MDIRSFFRKANDTTTNNKSQIQQTGYEPNAQNENFPVSIVNDPLDNKNNDNSSFLNSDLDDSPKTTRLKKKSKISNTENSLFDYDSDDASDNKTKKIYIRQLCDLEDKSNYSRQVNLTDYFNSSSSTCKTNQNSQSNNTGSTQIKNVDFNSYLDSIDIDNNLSLPNLPNFNSNSFNETQNISATFFSSIDSVPDTTNDVKTIDQCHLKDKKIVFTGVLKTIDRDDAIEAVRKLGGVVVSAVSAQIDYLVFGELLEDGRPYTSGTKYKKFCDINKIINQRLKFDKNARLPIQLIDETNFAIMIKSVFNPSDNSDQASTFNPINATNTIAQQGKKNELGPKAVPNNKIGTCSLPLLWTDKYAPKSMNDFVGNQLQLKRLKEWLNSWKSANLISNNSMKRDKSTFKCALISGPPGIGKTTSARLIVNQCGYSSLEFNASDQRNKQAIEQISIMATGGITLSFSNVGELNPNTCLIMDEVDGISSGDRGGSQALHRLIDKSICPIICICNDRNSAKIRSLANICLDLKFAAPSKMLLVQRLKKICQNEKISVDDETLNSLCDSRKCDIRQCINALQFSSNSKNPFTTKNPTALAAELKVGEKDANLIISPFDICQKLLSPANPNDLSITYILDYFFADYDMVPLMMQENYIKFIKDSLASSQKWFALCTTTDYFVISDVLYKNIYNKQQFGMLPELGYFTSVLPTFMLKSLNSSRMNERLDFPKWLGKYSSCNKNKRLLHEFHICTSGKIKSQSTFLIDGLLDLVYLKVMNVLLKGDFDGTIEIMNELGVTRDFLINGYNSLMFQGQENLYDKLTSKIKTAFTRKYNSQAADVSVGGARNKSESKASNKLIVDDDSVASDDALEDLLSENSQDDDLYADGRGLYRGGRYSVGGNRKRRV